MSDDDLLEDLRAASDRIEAAIARIESGDVDEDGTDEVAPCPECGAEFETLTGKLDHARDAHGIDV